MIIQAIIIIGFLSLLVVLLGNPNSYRINAFIKIGVMLLSLAAIIVVLFPNSLNDVARLVGVTRGADLMLYGLTMAFIFTLLNSYITAKSNQNKIVQLARKIALLEAAQRNKKDSDT